MYYSKTLLFSGLFLLFTSVYCERDYTCSGHVYDATTLEDIDSAEIICGRIDNPTHSIRTDANGNFNFTVRATNAKPVEYRVRKEGYYDEAEMKCSKDEQIALEN